MVTVGAHVSISGGFDKAVARQVELGGTVGQVFVGSPRGWSVRDIDADEGTDFQQAVTAADMGPWIVHGTYLINLATPKDDLGSKSINTLQGELDACAALGIPYYVFHPGAHTGAGVEQGVANVADRLSNLDIPTDVTLLLENTAGQGTTIGATFEQLHEMVAQSTYTYDEIGICLDSCHMFAAGFDFRTETGMADLVATVDELVGVDQVEYLHLNDSKHPCGSEKDEHEHIGEGAIGDSGFRTLLTDDAFRELPMVLETPDDEKGYAWNIQKVNELTQ